MHTKTAIAAMFVSLFAAQSADAMQSGTDIARSGSRQSRTGSAPIFTGSVRIDPLFETTDYARAHGSSVWFAAGARTAWHTHPQGQVLIVTSGIGRVQRWGAPVEEIRPGDVVRIPPDAKHWHGAAPTTAMTHISIVEDVAGRSGEWMEQVSDEQYRAPVRGEQRPAPTPGARADTARQTPSSRSVGDVAPALADLTNRVLYGEVWARPQLSQRDRSLVTVSALVAMNRPDQLRSHLARARANGLTQEELIESITHLAFYAGWPSAVTAIGVAREVFEGR